MPCEGEFHWGQCRFHGFIGRPQIGTRQKLPILLHIKLELQIIAAWPFSSPIWKYSLSSLSSVLQSQRLLLCSLTRITIMFPSQSCFPSHRVSHACSHHCLSSTSHLQCHLLREDLLTTQIPQLSRMLLSYVNG